MKNQNELERRMLYRLKVELKIGVYYWYNPPYGKADDIYKCLECYFNEQQDQWLARFEIMTDTAHSNSIGYVKKLNEVEINRYISKIVDLNRATRRYKLDQLSQELQNLEDNE